MISHNWKGILHQISYLRSIMPVSFYENILGQKKTAEWPTSAIFDVGGVQFGLERGRKPEIFLLVDNLDEAYKNLKEKERF